MKYNTVISSVLLACISMSGFAFELGKPLVRQVPLSEKAHTATAATKSIAFMNIKLTPAQRSQFTRIQPFNPNATLIQSPPNIPAKVDLGMNNTPVLDQGVHGSCVTFANTAALDALIGKGDYVSQLCSLAVGSYMAERSYYPSGWDGSTGAIVINQLLQLGIINKATQGAKTCGGLSEYPTNSVEISQPMSLKEYKSLSSNLNQNLLYRPIMSLADRISWGEWDDLQDRPQSLEILQRVKEAIANKPDPLDANTKGRVTLGILLPIDFCNTGACGKYKASNDTWLLTDAIKASMPDTTFGAHEMIITGYDDNATLVDSEGKTHKGLLKLRNSWGTYMGDRGDYYMTYEFFCQFVFELHQLIWVPDAENSKINLSQSS